MSRITGSARNICVVDIDQPGEGGEQPVHAPHPRQLLLDAGAAERIVAIGERADDGALVREELVERADRHAGTLGDLAHPHGIAAAARRSAPRPPPACARRARGCAAASASWPTASGVRGLARIRVELSIPMRLVRKSHVDIENTRIYHVCKHEEYLMSMVADETARWKPALEVEPDGTDRAISDLRRGTGNRAARRLVLRLLGVA